MSQIIEEIILKVNRDHSGSHKAGEYISLQHDNRLLRNGVRPAGYDAIHQLKMNGFIIDSEVEPDEQDDIYKVKPMFWTKAVSRFFTVGLWVSVVLLLAYLAAMLGAEVDMDFLINLQLMDML